MLMQCTDGKVVQYLPLTEQTEERKGEREGGDGGGEEGGTVFVGCVIIISGVF